MKKNILTKFMIALCFVSLPFMVMAQPFSDGYQYPSDSSSGGINVGVGNVPKLIAYLEDVARIATQLILAAAVVYFMWGVFKYVKSAGDEKAREEGQNHIIYGVIGIAVMVSLWGLVYFFTSSAKLTEGTFTVPKLLNR